MKFLNAMLAVLMAAMSIWFTSCSKDDNKEPDLSSELIIGKWYSTYTSGHYDTRYYLEFKTDKTYSYVSEKETINGTYQIKAIEKRELIEMNFVDSLNINELGKSYDATLLRIKTQENSVFDGLQVYHYYPTPGGEGCLFVHFSMDGLAQISDRVYRKN